MELTLSLKQGKLCNVKKCLNKICEYKGINSFVVLPVIIIVFTTRNGNGESMGL